MKAISESLRQEASKAKWREMHSNEQKLSWSPCIPQSNLERLHPHTGSSLHLLAILKLYFLQFLPTTTISFPLAPFAFGIGREAGLTRGGTLLQLNRKFRFFCFVFPFLSPQRLFCITSH
jgi:hypothetical protein